MRFWIREAAGWVLVVLGLFAFYRSYSLLITQEYVGGVTLSVIGIFLFRGGIHLLKIATAARICLLAHEEAEAARLGAAASGRFVEQWTQPRRR
jgi:hypothetical protein